MKQTIFIVFLTLLIYRAFAEDTTSVANRVMVMSNVSDEGAVELRWAPNNHQMWELTNKYGYKIERFTIYKDGKRIQTPADTRKQFNSKPLKPTSLSEWEELAGDNKYALIGAEMIYAENPQLSANMFINAYKQKQLDINKYSIAMFCADQSVKVATLMGLYFKDTSTTTDGRYLYRITPLITEAEMATQPGIIYVDMLDSLSLPNIIDFDVEFRDKKANLSWENKYPRQAYASMVVEKSVKGGAFRRVNDLPFITVEKNNSIDRDFYVDTLQSNNDTVSYRVYGITPFNEKGPYSKVVAGKGLKKISLKPENLKFTQQGLDTFLISWNIPDEAPERIRHYNIYTAPNLDTRFVKTGEADTKANKYLLIKQQNAFFVKIASVNSKGEEKFSQPCLVTQVDKIPPAMPDILEAGIDSTGKVTIIWHKNSEPDILRYRVYHSYSRNAEFSCVATPMAGDTIFNGYENLNTLADTIYFEILSEDYSYNYSPTTGILALAMPDTMPPAKPFFTNTMRTDTSVTLTGTKSMSSDIMAHFIIKRNTKSGYTQKFAIDNDSLQIRFTDYDVSSDSLFAYTIKAVDKHNNTSQSNELTIKAIDRKEFSAFSGITYEIDRKSKHIQISWPESDKQIKKILVYRATGNQPMRLYDNIKGNPGTYTDNKLTINTNYTYKFKAYTKQGKTSKMSKKLEVEY